jgi:putative copper export protein
MTVSGWSLVRFVHVLSAMCWVGGQLTLTLLVLPVLRADIEPGIGRSIVRKTATRFGLVANVVLLPLLIGTGLALAAHRHVGWSTLSEDGYGRLLSIKLALVVVSIALAGLHGVLAARRGGGARPFALAGLASSVAIVVFATALVP